MSSFVTAGGDIGNGELLAQNAQDTADNANSSVNNINDPNKLGPAEKTTLKRKYDTDVLLYGMDTKKLTDNHLSTSEIDSAMSALTAYMTPFFANMSTTDTVNRDALNTVYKDFDTADKNADSVFTNMVSSAASDAMVAGNQAKIAGSEAVVAGQQASSAASSAAVQASVAVSNTNVAQSSVVAAIAKAGSASDAANEASQAASSALAGATSAQSDASSAVAKAESTALAFGPVKQSADSAAASALSAQSYASTAVTQASSAAADSKDAKQIAGAVSQSYKTLTDGSTMTIAELEGGLAVKLTKTDLDGYATENWAQNQINATADGINATLSSVKTTVDGQTTSINDLKADSSSFKSQFTTVNDTLGKQTTDIGSLQASSKELTSGFNTLTSDNTTNKNDISQLKQTSTEVSSTLETVQTQVQNSAVGTNLIVQSELKSGFLNISTGGVGGGTVDFHSDNYIPTNGATVFTFGSPDYVFKGSSDHTLEMYDSDKNYLGYQLITSATQTLSKSNVAYIRFSINSADEGNTTGNSSDWLANHRYKLEKGNLATDWCPNPADNATVTALTKVKQTADGAQALATNNQGDITSLQATAKGLQASVSNAATKDQLNILSDTFSNEISSATSAANSKMIQTINNASIGFVNPDGSKFQMSLSADGVALMDFSKIMLNGATNIANGTIGTAQIADAAITNAKIGKLAVGTAQIADLAVTSAKVSEIDAGLIKSGTIDTNRLNADAIIANVINGKTINGITINTPTLNLGANGTLTTSFNLNQPTSFYAPKKGTGTLTIKTGVINSNSQNMSRYSNTAAYWYGFDDNGNMVKDGTNITLDDYAPGYEKHDIMKSTGTVLNRGYLDAMGLTFTEGGNTTYNTMLTGVGLETAAALLHQDLATEGTFEARLGTDNTYGFKIGSHVISPMIQANKYTYAANMFISSYGTMGSSTSTKVNKLNITDVPDMLQKGYNLLTLNPRQWFDKTSVEAYADVQAGNTDSVESVVDIKPVSGMVAEEVASAGLDDYVIKDENNKVQGLAYDRLWTLLLPVLRDMNDRLNEAQLEITKLKGVA